MLSAPLVYDEYKGHLYGLPQVTDFPTLLYNWNELKKLALLALPPPWRSLKNDAVEIVRHKAAKYGFEFGGTSYYALPFLYACGGGMFDHHDNILVNNTGSAAGLNFLVKLQNADNPQVMPPDHSFSVSPWDHGTGLHEW